MWGFITENSLTLRDIWKNTTLTRILSQPVSSLNPLFPLKSLFPLNPLPLPSSPNSNSWSFSVFVTSKNVRAVMILMGLGNVCMWSIKQGCRPTRLVMVNVAKTNKQEFNTSQVVLTYKKYNFIFYFIYLQIMIYYWYKFISLFHIYILKNYRI